MRIKEINDKEFEKMISENLHKYNRENCEWIKNIEELMFGQEYVNKEKKEKQEKEERNIIQTKIKKDTKREESFQKACDMTGIKIHEATPEEIKQGLFIKCNNEIIKLTIDNNGNYIIDNQDEFTMQKKMVNEPNNTLRKRYKIIGKKQNNK